MKKINFACIFWLKSGYFFEKIIYFYIYFFICKKKLHAKLIKKYQQKFMFLVSKILLVWIEILLVYFYDITCIKDRTCMFE